jgi:hypothetical protein
MLKVNYGVIGGKGFVALEMEVGDRENIIEIAKENPKFEAHNGCELNLQDILQGKICLPCTESQFELVEEAIMEFNEVYLPDTRIIELVELGEIRDRVAFLEEQNAELEEENERLRAKLTKFREAFALLN